MNLFELLSSIFSYIFITIIYLFIFSIIRLIYMDIKQTQKLASPEPINNDDFSLAELEDEQFGILRVVSARETVENLSDEYILDQESVTIGRMSRKSGCDIQISDVFLSSEHLKLEFDGEQWIARDLGSRNGTFVNGEAIDTCTLRNGDQIALGGVIFELEV